MGGGAIGLASAWALSRAGARVTLVEAGALGQGAVWASGGMLAAGFEACFELAPDHELADAYAAFLLQSQSLWRDWAPEVQGFSGQDPGYESYGSVTPVFVQAERARLEQAYALARRFGVRAELVTGAGLSALEPALAPAREALVFPEDGQLDNRALGAIFSAALRAKGVKLIEQARVQSLIRTAGRVSGVRLQSGAELQADCVVLATGAEQFADLEAPVRMMPVKGQMIRFDWPRAKAPRRVVRGLSIYLAAKSGGRLIAGASSEPGQADLETDPDVIERLAAAARLAMPGLEERPVMERWAGLRPCSRDGMPIVGESEPGLVLALGAYRNGVLTAPGMAELVMQALGAAPRTAALNHFSPARASLRS